MNISLSRLVEIMFKAKHAASMVAEDVRDKFTQDYAWMLAAAKEIYELVSEKEKESQS